MKRFLLAAVAAVSLATIAGTANAGGWCYNGYGWVRGYYWGHACMAGGWHPYAHPSGPGYYWGHTWMPGAWHSYGHPAYVAPPQHIIVHHYYH